MAWITDFRKKTVDALDIGEHILQGESYLRLGKYKKKASLLARVNYGGERFCKTFGEYGVMSIADFKQKAIEFKAQILSGDFQSGKCLTYGEFTTDTVIPDSLKNHRDHYNFILRAKACASQLGDFKLNEIDRFAIHKALAELDNGWSPATYNRHVAVISKTFSLAVEMGIIDSNPCFGFKKKIEDNIVTRKLEGAGIPSFIEIALADASVFFGHALVLALFTGMRIGNCCSITRSMISDDFTSIRLEMTKSGEPQVIYLSDRSQDIVRKCLDLSTNEFLFPSPVNLDTHIGRPIKCFNRIKAEMVSRGLMDGDLTIHDLRRTFSNCTYQATGDMNLVKEALGHHSIEVTKRRYVHTQNKKLIAAVQETADFMTNTNQ